MTIPLLSSQKPTKDSNRVSGLTGLEAGLLLRVNTVTGVLLFAAVVICSMMYGAVGCAFAVVSLTLVQAVIGITGILRSKREAGA
jgi:hypothetical protein